jgi:hypothetical protein
VSTNSHFSGTNLQTEDTNLLVHHPTTLISKLILILQLHLDTGFKMILTKLKTYQNHSRKNHRLIRKNRQNRDFFTALIFENQKSQIFEVLKNRIFF